ncbi:SufD family Fe-S cluster assembly protein [Candidatus Uhrbacteria bacterium]|nr:SufD family Fe-S cluster assembly protein [Candidatus Uhrbacteria bacterium]
MQKIELLHEIVEKDRTIAVAAHETLDYFFVLFADALIERRIRFELADGARANVRGVLLGNATADITLETDMVHRGKNTEGFTTVKGILTDRARARVTGWIRIPETGNNTNAFLEQRFLLLSKTARAKAEPMLEILANDVKASHAASVSRLNDEQIFYAESRGLDPDESRHLLTEAFINEIVQKIPDRAISVQCEKQLSKFLTPNP